MEEIKKDLEGKEINDSLEATSTSEEPVVGLNNSPVPTEAEIKDAELPAEQNPVPNHTGEVPVAGDDLSENDFSEAEQPEMPQTAPEVSENVETERVCEENGVVESPALKTFTQNQVNEMMGGCRTETREKTFRYIYDRYGVNDETGLDELVGNAQRFDSLKEEHDRSVSDWKKQSAERDMELANLKEQVALMQSGIDKERYEDAKYILKGKGLEVNAENINSELVSHPEWKKTVNSENANANFKKVEQPETKISVLGNERPAEKSGMSEEELAMRMFDKHM